MPQPSCRFSFTSKARNKLIVSRKLWMDHFDGDSASGAEVCGAIDGAHSSLSEELLDLVFVVE